MAHGAATDGAPPVRARHEATFARLGIRPPLHDRVAAILDRELADAARRTTAVAVLDAGCGHRSPLRPLRPRISRLVGIDLHPPPAPLCYLDDFATVDLCAPMAAMPDGPFDVVVSNFTFEHLDDPAQAIDNVHGSLRAGGSLVIVTVNRRHPFVGFYLGLPAPLRDRLQRVLKATSADAHRLVGACNDPDVIRASLRRAGFDPVELETVSNLGRAWGRHRATFVLGAIGDRLWHGSPGRRSTIIVVARKGPTGKPATPPA